MRRCTSVRPRLAALPLPYSVDGGPGGIAVQLEDTIITAGPSEDDARRQAMNTALVPGARVRHPDQPDWGIGQVQSVIGDRVTVNFEDRGKVLINAAVVELEVVERERPD